jgi:arginyl-tRNA synthetase
MVSQNPFDQFRQECQTALANALKKTVPEIQQPTFTLNKTPNIDYGQLASSLCFELAKKLRQKPLALAQQLVDAMDKSSFNLIEKVEPAGAGYINFHVNFAKFSELTLDSVKKLGFDYGFVKTEEPKKIIVEHTSVNPLHPIHIGQARNPMLGDALARILQYRGHEYHAITTLTMLDDNHLLLHMVMLSWVDLNQPRKQTFS